MMNALDTPAKLRNDNGTVFPFDVKLIGGIFMFFSLIIMSFGADFFGIAGL